MLSEWNLLMCRTLTVIQTKGEKCLLKGCWVFCGNLGSLKNLRPQEGRNREHSYEQSNRRALLRYPYRGWILEPWVPGGLWSRYKFITQLDSSPLLGKAQYGEGRHSSNERGLQKKGEEAVCWADSSSSSHPWTDANVCRTHHIRPKGRSTTAHFLWVTFWLSGNVSGQGQWALGLPHTPKPWTMGVRQRKPQRERGLDRNTDGPRNGHNERHKSDRERQISYDTAHTWNLRKWHKWTYLQNRKTESQIEKTNVRSPTGKEGEG